MTSTVIAAAVMGVAMIGTSVTGYAQKTDLGKREYDGNCAVCHGPQGKGDGPYAGLLNTRTPDLTTLAGRNGGVFPFVRVYELIDGTQVVIPHGTRDMPIWGTKYNAKAAEEEMHYSYNPEVFVRVRILALTEYVYRLQAR